jgi:hypothetical protein
MFAKKMTESLPARLVKSPVCTVGNLNVVNAVEDSQRKSRKKVHENEFDHLGQEHRTKMSFFSFFS